MAFYKEDIVDINLNTGNIFRSFLGHSIGYKDDDADRFGIRAFRDGVPVDLSGASCQAIFMNPNGTNIALTSYGTVSGNVAYVTLPPACYDYEGQFCLAIKLVGDGVTGTVRIVDGTVTRTGASGAVAPTSSVPTYQEILSTYDAMVAATSAANLAIAETFDATKAYPAGKYVINEGHLYRLTADHAANVTWANTSKVATNFGDDLSSLKSALNTESYSITTESKLIDYTENPNKYIKTDGTLASNTDWHTSGDINIGNGIIIISGTFQHLGTNGYNIAFYDDNGFNHGLNIDGTVENYIIDCNGMTKVMICNRNSYSGETYRTGEIVDKKARSTFDFLSSTDALHKMFLSEISNGLKINMSDGSVVSSTGSYVTSLLPVKNMVHIYIEDSRKMSDYNVFNIAFYKADGTFVSGEDFGTNREIYDKVIQVPANAVYMRICNLTNGYHSTDYIETATPIGFLNESNLVEYIKVDKFNINTIVSNNAIASYSGWSTTVPIPVNKYFHLHIDDATQLFGSSYRTCAFFKAETKQPFGLSYVSSIDLITGENDIYGQVPGDADYMVLSLPNTKAVSTNSIYCETLRHQYRTLYIDNATDLYAFIKSPVPYTKVILKAGTYDIYTGLMATDIAADYLYYGYMHDIEIEGNNSEIKLLCPDSVATSHATGANNAAVFNIIGNCKIRDLTLNTKNVRYSVHVETQESPLGFYADIEFINMTIKNDRGTGVATNGNAVGIGGSKGQKIRFERCNISTTTGFAQIYVHGRTYNISEIVFDSCNIANGIETGISLSQYTGNGKKTLVTFIDSIIGRVYCTKQTGGENYQYQFVLESINSYITEIAVRSDLGVSFIEDPKIINTISGTVNNTIQ